MSKQELLPGYQRVSLVKLEDRPVFVQSGPKFADLQMALEYEAVCAYGAHFTGFLATPEGIKAFISEGEVGSGYVRECDESLDILHMISRKEEIGRARYRFELRDNIVVFNVLSNRVR